MAGERSSTPDLTPFDALTQIEGHFRDAVSELPIDQGTPLHRHLRSLLDHQFENSEVDLLALILATARQNVILNTQLAELTAQAALHQQRLELVSTQVSEMASLGAPEHLTLLTNQVGILTKEVKDLKDFNSSAHFSTLLSTTTQLANKVNNFAADCTASLSHVRSSVAALEHKVGNVTHPPPPPPTQPRNAQPAQPPARRQATNTPAAPPGSSANPRPSFAAVAARAGTAPSAQDTPPAKLCAQCAAPFLSH